MRPSLLLSLATATLALAAPARAEEPSVPHDLGRLILDTGRVAAAKPEEDLVHLSFHGEAQLRGQLQRAFPLDVTASTLDKLPGAISDSTGRRSIPPRCPPTR
jgi:hypothetical protein